MKKLLLIFCFLLAGVGLMQAKTVTGYFSFDKVVGNGTGRFAQKPIPVRIVIDESVSPKTITIYNMFGYDGEDKKLEGTYGQKSDGTYAVMFKKEQKVAMSPNGQDVYALYNIKEESSYYPEKYELCNGVNDEFIKATISKDGKSLAFTKNLGLLNFVIGGSYATVAFLDCSITFSTNLFEGVNDIDIFLDNTTTGIVKTDDGKDKSVALQKAFFNGAGYDGILKPVEPADMDGYVVNPCASRTAKTFTGLTAAQKSAFAAAGYKTDWLEGKEWRAVGCEASLNTTDDFQAEMAKWVGSDKYTVSITRSAYNEMTDAGDIVTKWIKPNKTMQMDYEMYDVRTIVYNGTMEVKTPCGVHFKDIIPVLTSTASPYYVDYVVYWYGKVKDDMVKEIPASQTARNTSFVKVGNDWYYYAIPDDEFKYVANSVMNYAEETGAAEPEYTKPVGYHLRVEFDLDKLPTGVDGVETAKQVVAVRYYNLQGMGSAKPFDGVNVVRTTYSDGSTQVTKKVIK